MSQVGQDNRLPVCFVCEASFDYRVARTLFERVARAKVSWLADADLDHHFRFIEFDGQGFLAWKDVPRVIRDLGLVVRVTGNTLDKGLADYHATYRALTALRQRDVTLRSRGIVVFLRDLDNQPERREGIRRAYDAVREKHGSPRGAAGCPNTKVECWCLAAYPRDRVSREKFEQVRQRLSFDPLTNAHQLSVTGSEKSDARNDAKRVLSDLLGNTIDEHMRGIVSTDLSTLKDRGTDVSISSFLQSLEEALDEIVIR